MHHTSRTPLTLAPTTKFFTNCTNWGNKHVKQQVASAPCTVHCDAPDVARIFIAIGRAQPVATSGFLKKKQTHIDTARVYLGQLSKSYHHAELACSSNQGHEDIHQQVL
jgi:hypothetical protein